MSVDAPVAEMEAVTTELSPRIDELASSEQPRRRFDRSNASLRKLSMRLRDGDLPRDHRHAVETARVAAMLRSVPSNVMQPELYIVPEGDESDDEPVAAHAAPRTIQQSKELLDRVERMRKFHSHDYEPPVRFRLQVITVVILCA